ncbi:MAG TPA: nitroreductase/quinone reductase family protein, partial [Acidimicrobiales bacterium]|nr:nitroreductase/quinone reductase family protein [Acidimicrobiales bacterium]
WRVTSSRPGAWLFARLSHHIDLFVLKASRGRWTLARVLAGIPVIILVTTGARSGERRSTPLLGVPMGDDLAIIGTRFGQSGTPGWYFNLRKQPAAEVVYDDRHVPVLAREAEGPEWQEAWDRARRIYSGYEAYARRITDRQVHVMVLSASAP